MALRTFLILCAAALCLSAPAAETNQILFLRVKLKEGVVTLVESSVRPGLLKTQRDAPKKLPLQFAVETAADQPLWQHSMDDPTLVRIESADPDSGVLEPVIIQRDEAEFTIRVPVKRGMHHVAFYREEITAAAAAPGAVKKAERKLIGKILTPIPQ